MIDSYNVLREPFDIETHKKIFINYLEVIITIDGTIMYAVPSHQEKLIAIACEKLKLSRDELYNICPPEYYFDIMMWLCQITNSIALWNEHMIGIPNEVQKKALEKLIKEDLYNGVITWES